ncbi:MAG: pyridoxine 5'-phosphate synthase [Cytophagaceae bacterium]|jgi:pyridoxine 5-phosphate synthase|nr:pyridoxine 5'-phosphate synthase [Cytophagaceae bacterium]
MTKLSVNINKIATIRNARGGNNPNVLQVALDCERFGADGITVHPRPDERHIRYSDVRLLKQHIQTEFNIEGNPEPAFIDLVTEVKPAQVTLVPDGPQALTSDSGWDTQLHQSFLQDICRHFHSVGIRVSIFVNPDIKMVEGAHAVGADRIELYTEPYASTYVINPEKAVESYKLAAAHARRLGMGINAGHDLDLHNLHFLKKNIPYLDEVSIGHALICDALYFGLENTIQQYKYQLKKPF